MVSTASSEKFTHFLQYSDSFSVKYCIVKATPGITTETLSLKKDQPGIEEEFLCTHSQAMSL